MQEPEWGPLLLPPIWGEIKEAEIVSFLLIGSYNLAASRASTSSVDTEKVGRDEGAMPVAINPDGCSRLAWQ